MDKYTHRVSLQQIARRAMTERGLEPDYTVAELAELEKISSPAIFKSDIARDLRDLPWCSVDNENSQDLDQLSYAEQLTGSMVKVLVAVSDVDALVSAQSGINSHASLNTTTVYTVAQVFPMLPEKLCTNLTSLSLDADRCAIVVDMVVDDNGMVQQSDVYSAFVRNHAKLEYKSLAAWLEGTGSVPAGITKIPGLAENIKLQDRVAQKLKELRQVNGALELETFEAAPVFDGDTLTGMKVEHKNRAKNLIEDFMIAANGSTARYLAGKNFPSLRRVVRSPRHWDRIVELASENEFSLPDMADSKSLSDYLKFVKQKDPLQFADMSLSVLKLLGSGEYVLETPGATPPGHFGLAVKDYTHSTAPNRRYPDLVTQRLLKSAITGSPIPYKTMQLEEIARNCTLKEDYARKVERQVEKSAAAILMESKIGEEFDAIVTGASTKGTWIRIFNPHAEGKLIHGFEGLKVGYKLKVRLIHTNVEAGFIDFDKV